MGKQHTIELNGNQYNALTGKMITKEHPAAVASTNPPQMAPRKNIDGIARQAPRLNKTAENRRPVQKSHTLMRKTVHKPAVSKLHAVATVVGYKHQGQPNLSRTQQSGIKTSVKSGLIRRFNPIAGNSVVPEVVKGRSISRPATKTSPLSHTAVSAASVVVNPLHQAIASAPSHQQPKLKHPRLHARIAGKLHVSPKIISGISAALAVVLIAGFFGYQNIPNLKMRLASSRAGLHGTLPGYQPPGFRLGEISYKPGQINIGFRSNSDTRSFTVTQETSSWNSDTLRDKLKTTQQVSSPVEVPDKGKTLYIYNDDDVAWVDGGILYKIEGDSKLNSEQLLHLANSL